MAITFVQGKGNSPGGPQTFASPVTAGNLLVAAVVGYDGATYPVLPSMSDNINGATWTKASQAGNAAAGTISIYYKLSAGAGSTTVSFGNEMYAAWVAEFSGGTFATDGANGASYTSNATYVTPTLITSAADVVIAASVIEQAGGFSAGTIFTSLPATNDGGCAAGYYLQPSAGSISASFTQSPAGDAGAAIAAFTIGGGPPPATTPSPALMLLGCGS
jgi:hypothetical protein